MTLACVAYGMGKPMLTLDKADIPQAMKFSTFAVFCNGIAMCLLKVAIGLSLLRINLSRMFTIVIIGSIIISMGVNLTVFASSFGACKPMEKIWNKDPNLPGTCWP